MTGVQTCALPIYRGIRNADISDHGNMYGVFQFVAEAYKHVDENGKPKVKPVVGCEFYLVEDRHQKTFTKDRKDKRFHQILNLQSAPKA